MFDIFHVTSLNFPNIILMLILSTSKLVSVTFLLIKRNYLKFALKFYNDQNPIQNANFRFKDSFGRTVATLQLRSLLLRLPEKNQLY